MEKENTNQIIKRVINANLMDIIFERVEPVFLVDEMTDIERLIKTNKDAGINVQSVCLPKDHKPFVQKTEPQILNWLQNKIHSQYSAFYQINQKYSDDIDQVSWNNNKSQNKRYLETNGSN